MEFQHSIKRCFRKRERENRRRTVSRESKEIIGQTDLGKGDKRLLPFLMSFVKVT